MTFDATEQVPATVQHLGLDGAGDIDMFTRRVRPRGRASGREEPSRLAERERETRRSAGGHVDRLGGCRNVPAPGGAEAEVRAPTNSRFVDRTKGRRGPEEIEKSDRDVRNIV